MKLTRNIAALVAVVSIGVGSALAAGLWANSLPVVTPPMTGNECIPGDTNLTSGQNPATECLYPGNITGLAEANALGYHSNIPIGSVAYGSLGTNTTDVAGQLWESSFQLPLDRFATGSTLTGIQCLQGGTATTDSVIGALYKVNLAGSGSDTTKATLVANSALAGTALSGANTFLTLAFTTPYAAHAGKYFMVVQGNGTAAGAIRTIAASTYLGITATTLSGTFGTLPSTITYPTTFTANDAPICYVY